MEKKIASPAGNCRKYGSVKSGTAVRQRGEGKSKGISGLEGWEAEEGRVRRLRKKRRWVLYSLQSSLALSEEHCIIRLRLFPDTENQKVYNTHTTESVA